MDRYYHVALHPQFPSSPYEPLILEQRWFPAAEELRAKDYAKLLPPLVANIRREAHAWRAFGYSGAFTTTRALLEHGFEAEHFLETATGTLSQFRYYFAQREAVETATAADKPARYDFVYVDQAGFTKHRPATFAVLAEVFTEYKK